MSLNSVDEGDVVELSASFRDASSQALLDPDVVTLRIQKGTNAVVILTYGIDSVIVKDGVGLYHADLTMDVPGTFTYRWLSTGVGGASHWRSFTVRAAPI